MLHRSHIINLMIIMQNMCCAAAPAQRGGPYAVDIAHIEKLIAYGEQFIAQNKLDMKTVYNDQKKVQLAQENALDYIYTARKNLEHIQTQFAALQKKMGASAGKTELVAKEQLTQRVKELDQLTITFVENYTTIRNNVAPGVPPGQQGVTDFVKTRKPQYQKMLDTLTQYQKTNKYTPDDIRTLEIEYSMLKKETAEYYQSFAFIIQGSSQLRDAWQPLTSTEQSIDALIAKLREKLDDRSAQFAPPATSYR